LDKICGVYKITNSINKKFYIGSSVDILARWNRHKNALNNHRHHSVHLQRAWDKFGEKIFTFEILEECIEDDRLKLEQKYLDDTQCYDEAVGYNISHLARGKQVFGKLNSSYGKHWTTERKEQMSKIKKGTITSEETKEKLRNHWATHTPNMTGKTGELAPCYGRVGEKHPLYGKRGKDCVVSKRTICLTTGEVFDSATIASEKMNANKSKVCMCCRGERKSSGKLDDGTPLRWMYYEDYVKLDEAI
jgi:group I intron endonuclease